MTIIWSAGLIFFGYLAQGNRHCCWCSSLWFSCNGLRIRMMVLWDFARYQGFPNGVITWIISWITLSNARFLLLFFLLQQENLRGCLFSWRSLRHLYEFVSLVCSNNEFKITFLGCVPTEIRILFILVNTSLIFFALDYWTNPYNTSFRLPYRPWYRRLPNAAIHLEHWYGWQTRQFWKERKNRRK